MEKELEAVRIVSSRCEDYPCCGHGPPPLGDSGGCPVKLENVDTGATWEQWPCASCGGLMPKGNRSAICNACGDAVRACMVNDCPGCPTCEVGND